MDLVCRHGGSTSFKRESRLAECWRDLHTVGQTVTLAPEWYPIGGPVYVGLDPRACARQSSTSRGARLQTSGRRSGPHHVPKRAVGVERDISSSSSVMSAGISANNGVLRYRSPVSGSMQRTVAPLAASRHTWGVPPNGAPAVMPTKIPSF